MKIVCIGYILEVDLEYLDELHGLHNDYPLVPEKLKIDHGMLSRYCSEIAHQYGTNFGGVDILFPNLGNKSKYVLHYRNHQLRFPLGFEID